MTNGLLILLLMLLLGSWLPAMREPNRLKSQYTAITTLIGLLLAWLAPNPFLAVLIALMTLGVWWCRVPSENLPLTLWPALLFATAYVILSHQVTSAWILPVLWMMVLIGVVHGLVMIVFVLQKRPLLTAFQGNTNYAQGVAATCTAATVGLALTQSWWCWLLVPLSLYPIVAVDIRARESCHAYGKYPSQGLMLVGVLGIAMLVLTWPVVGLTMGGLMGVAGSLLIYHNPAYLSKRDAIWRHGLKAWWRMPWPGKLLGAGTGTWTMLYQHDQPTPELATTAHNEYLQTFVEHGVIGFVALVSYCAMALWISFHAGVLGVPVFLVVSVLCACAVVSFPWTLYHEAYIIQTNEIYGHGSPTLNVLTLATMVILEAL